MKVSAGRTVWVVLPVAILLGAGAIAAALVLTRDKPQRSEPRAQGALVTTETVHRASHRLNVQAQGTVLPARVVTVQPQVSGRLLIVHENLVPGGLLDEGERLVLIDPSDYKAAVKERKTALDQAEAQLRIEEGQQQIAEREWTLFRDKFGAGQFDPALALRKPQLESVQAAVDAARARLERAQLDLDRTSIEVPFDCFVRSESAEVGQIVTPQAPLATLVGTAAFWVRVSVPMDRLAYIDIPAINSETGSLARIVHDAGSGKVEREGKVLRLFGDLDPAGRMARLLVEVPDPLGLRSSRGGSDAAPPLLVDAYVDVVIEGNQIEPLIEVPRQALREGNEVYVLGKKSTLEIRGVDIAWRLPDAVLVRAGLIDGDQVVTSRVPTPVEGMELRTAPGAAARDGGSAGKSRKDLQK